MKAQHIREIIEVLLALAVYALYLGMKYWKEAAESYKRSMEMYKKDNEWYDKWTDTLFNEEDMQKAYYAGKTNEKEGGMALFHTWLKDTYREVEPVDVPESDSIKAWAAQYHTDVKAGKKTY